jgi:cytochrome c biogenesis protein ResB
MKKLFDTLASRRVAVYVLFVILLLSIIGTFVPQNELPAFYDAKYVRWAAALFKVFQLTNIFHTWYFIFLLVFLGASITTCMVRRLRRLAIPFEKPPANISAHADDYQCSAAIGNLDGGRSLEEAARGCGCRWRATGGGFYGRRGVFAVWGESLTHIGLLLIFLAATLRLFGHRDEIFVFEGQSICLPRSYGPGYKLQVEKVKEVFDANTGRIMEYISTVRLYRDGNVVAAKEIEVNGPLHYGNVGIYQSSMDAAGMKGLTLEAVKLAPGQTLGELGRKTFHWRVGEMEGDVTAVPRDIVLLGDTGLKLLYVDYYDNYLETNTGYTNDNPAYNPAVFIHILNPQGDTAMGILEQKSPTKNTLRSADSRFSDKPVELSLLPDAGKAPAARTREYIFASGSDLFVGDGGDHMTLGLREGFGDDLAARSLDGELRMRGGEIKTYNFPYGARVPVKLTDGDYAFRFVGSKSAPVTGLTIARDPGLWLFYAGCLLLSLGVCVAMLLRYDEYFVFRYQTKVYLAARSNKGARVLKPEFEKWAAEAQERWGGGPL